MRHIFNRGKDPNKPTFLLLHGTGGNELDLLPLAGMIDDGANVLSVRGNVLENGMPRFFKRLAEGVFDEKDLIFRTEELNNFLNEAAEKYGFNRNDIIAIGYSNGANIAASLLFHYQNALKVRFCIIQWFQEGIEPSDLSGKSVFIAAGETINLPAGRIFGITVVIRKSRCKSDTTLGK